MLTFHAPMTRKMVTDMRSCWTRSHLCCMEALVSCLKRGTSTSLSFSPTALDGFALKPRPLSRSSTCTSAWIAPGRHGPAETSWFGFCPGRRKD